MRCRHCKSARVYRCDEEGAALSAFFYCADCDEVDLLKHLAEPGEGLRGDIPERLTIGERLVLPDGLRGTVATVEDDGESFTVEGWHERFDRIQSRLLEVA